MSKQMWTIEAQWSIVEVLEVFDNFREGVIAVLMFYCICINTFFLPYPNPIPIVCIYEVKLAFSSSTVNSVGLEHTNNK